MRKAATTTNSCNNNTAHQSTWGLTLALSPAAEATASTCCCCCYFLLLSTGQRQWTQPAATSTLCLPHLSLSLSVSPCSPLLCPGFADRVAKNASSAPAERIQQNAHNKFVFEYEFIYTHTRDYFVLKFTVSVSVAVLFIHSRLKSENANENMQIESEFGFIGRQQRVPKRSTLCRHQRNPSEPSKATS